MTAVAQVTIEIEMSADGSWRDNCTMSQIKRQANEQVQTEVQRLLKESKYRVAIKRCTLTTITIT